jgi:hypothetical protein
VTLPRSWVADSARSRVGHGRVGRPCLGTLAPWAGAARCDPSGRRPGSGPCCRLPSSPSCWERSSPSRLPAIPWRVFWASAGSRSARCPTFHRCPVLPTCASTLASRSPSARRARPPRSRSGCRPTSPIRTRHFCRNDIRAAWSHCSGTPGPACLRDRRRRPVSCSPSFADRSTRAPWSPSCSIAGPPSNA